MELSHEQKQQARQLFATIMIDEVSSYPMRQILRQIIFCNDLDWYRNLKVIKSFMPEMSEKVDNILNKEGN